MKLDKKSKQSDKIVNLYRAAFSLASGNQNLAASFINKSKTTSFQKKLKSKLNQKQQLILAEKILDQYHTLLLS